MIESFAPNGTPQRVNVQAATFGHRLSGQPASIRGYRRDRLRITDPAGLAASGSDRHPLVRSSDDAADCVSGTVFAITAEELMKAEGYEVSDYARVRAPLVDGGEAWVYVACRSQLQIEGHTALTPGWFKSGSQARIHRYRHCC